MRRLGVRTAVALGAAFGILLSLGFEMAGAAVGDIVERTVPGNRAGGLNRITTGPDGNIWFTDGGNNQIGRMTPDGVFTGFDLPIPNSGPVDITTGPDGALWFTEFEGRIGRITTSGQITEFTILPLAPPGTTPRHPLGITNGPDGALWFVTDCCDPANPGRIGRITTSGVITLFEPAPGTTPAPGIATGSDGNIWYSATATPSRIEGRIQRMSPDGVVNGDFRIPTAYSDPSRLVTGPDGNIWFTEQGAVGANGSRQPTFPAPGRIGRITPSGRIDEFTTPNQSYPNFVSNPAGIAVGPDGNLWFTEYSFRAADTLTQHGGNMIGRITTTGQITEFPIPTPFARADGITAGPVGDGGMYFTESPENFGFGAVGRIQAVDVPGLPGANPVTPPPAPPASTPTVSGPAARVRIRSFSARVSPRRDRRAPYRFTISGRLRTPAGIGPSACRGGRVLLRATAGRRTVSTRSVGLRSNCTYRVAVTFRSRRGLGSGRLALRVRFLGSSRFRPARTRTLFARAG
jgi:streptogramin lyase